MTSDPEQNGGVRRAREPEQGPVFGAHIVFIRQLWLSTMVYPGASVSIPSMVVG